ncbi:GNAT family N-acetyltransferase [Sediminicola luteus]|uniref:GNAT family N-acetyltransferase n=1 Tax=Sediminicola luteus TaxID=319238 RepID=A0A2A4G6Q7_9FLAO|nr:GNAT family N-acetyltransferase [Sediminicola luteus]PCE63660.1 GNAT family N-acetyltransferase [Sediminicola luteus]
MEKVNIRPIEAKDNAAIRKIIRTVLEEYGLDREGTAYNDPSLNDMTAFYQADGHLYLIAEIENKVLGGGGIGPLPNSDGAICELQKMYFSTDARGKGLGTQMITACLNAAKSMGYTQCYLETDPDMTVAQKMYLKHGFRYLDKAVGCTGHSACEVWMIKDL